MSRIPVPADSLDNDPAGSGGAPSHAGFAGSRPRSAAHPDRRARRKEGGEPAAREARSASSGLASMPDIGLQLAPCPGEIEQQALFLGLRGALEDPEAEVRALVFEGTYRVGIWLRAARTPADAEARERGLRHMRLTRDGETFAVLVSSGLVARRFNEAFAATAKRLDADGTPNPEGPIHLTGAWLAWEAPDRVIAHVRGFDEDPWPHAGFELAATDAVSVSGGELSARTERSASDARAAGCKVALAPQPSVFRDGETMVHEGGAADARALAAHGALVNFPRQLLLPSLPRLGAAKALFWYSRREVDERGVVAGGQHWIIPRVAAARIDGPTQIAVDGRSSMVTRRFSVAFEELRGPVEHVWTADGAVANDAAEATSITFDFGGMREGTAVKKRVTVKATDADGVTVEASLEVDLYLEIYSTIDREGTARLFRAPLSERRPEVCTGS